MSQISSYSDLDFIAQTQNTQYSMRIDNLRKIVDSYERQTIASLWTNLNQTLQNENQINQGIQQKMESLITGITNIFNVFTKLLKDENYIGLMTEMSVKQFCRNITNKAEAQWIYFSKAIFKSTTEQTNEILPRRNRKNQKISLKANIILQKWLLQNFSHPYPCSDIKGKLAKRASLNIHQVNNWFTNARERGLKKLRKIKEQKSNSDSEDHL